MDRETFYAALRKRNSGAFGTSLTVKQVAGTEAVLDECIRQAADLGQTAYILATAYGESGRKMQPTYEDLWYRSSTIAKSFKAHRRQGLAPQTLAGQPELLANTVYGGPWGAKNLGNTVKGDGWKFRGTGMGQITGRGNFGKWGRNMGLPLIEKPELLMELHVSVKALVQPMLEGWARGYKLSRYVSGAKRDYVGARAVWNHPSSAPHDYARWARAFETALEAAGYSAESIPVAKPQGSPVPNQTGGFISALLNLFRRKS